MSRSLLVRLSIALALAGVTSSLAAQEGGATVTGSASAGVTVEATVGVPTAAVPSLAAPTVAVPVPTLAAPTIEVPTLAAPDVAVLMETPPILAEVLATVDAEELELVERMRGAIAIPVAADVARDAGADEAEVREALDALEESDARPDAAVAVLSEAATGVREHGRVDRFGAFVHDRLAEGLRGRALASAIRAEHETRGTGRGAGAPGAASEAHGAAERPEGEAPGASGEVHGAAARPEGGAPGASGEAHGAAGERGGGRPAEPGRGRGAN